MPSKTFPPHIAPWLRPWTTHSSHGTTAPFSHAYGGVRGSALPPDGGEGSRVDRLRRLRPAVGGARPGASGDHVRERTQALAVARRRDVAVRPDEIPRRLGRPVRGTAARLRLDDDGVLLGVDLRADR